MLRKSSFVDFPFILIDPSFAVREYLQYVTVKFAQIRANVIFFSKNKNISRTIQKKRIFKKIIFRYSTHGYLIVVVHLTKFCGKLPTQ